MAGRKAIATWNGGLKDGKGPVALGSGLFEGAFSFETRMGEEPGTNPENCWGRRLPAATRWHSVATLEGSGTPAKSVKTGAKVHLGKDDAGFVIKGIDLSVVADVAGFDDAAFQAIAEKVSRECPISKALTGTKITLSAKLA